MPNQTTNYGLTKPLASELYNIDVQNENMDIIDGKLKDIETEASRHFARNLLDNSDFSNPVNQRGQTSYTGTYSIDRWRTHGSNMVTVNAGSITTSGSLNQYLEPKAVKNCDHTIAAMKADGTIVCYTRNPHKSYAEPGSGAMGLGTDTSAGIVVCRLKAGEYLWAALYEGAYTADTLPTYQPKGYGAELVECMRYYQVGGNTRLVTMTDGNGACSIDMRYPVAMRITPTVTIQNVKYRTSDVAATTDYTGNYTTTVSSVNFNNGYISGLAKNTLYTVTHEYKASADL